MAYLGNAPKQNLNTMNSQQFNGDNSETNFTESITVAATDNMMLCGPVSFTATVTVNGTLTVV